MSQEENSKKKATPNISPWFCHLLRCPMVSVGDSASGVVGIVAVGLQSGICLGWRQHW